MHFPAERRCQRPDGESRSSSGKERGSREAQPPSLQKPRPWDKGTFCSAEEHCAGSVPAAGACAPNWEKMEVGQREGAEPRLDEGSRLALSPSAPGHVSRSSCPLSSPAPGQISAAGGVTPPAELLPVPAGSGIAPSKHNSHGTKLRWPLRLPFDTLPPKTAFRSQQES